MIKALFAYTQMVDGEEMVCGMDMGHGPFPLYFYEEAQAMRFLEPAQAMCNARNLQLNLIKFESRRVIKAIARDPNATSQNFIDAAELFSAEEVAAADALKLDPQAVMDQIVTPIMPRILKMLGEVEPGAPPMEALHATKLLIRLAELARE